MERNAKAFAAGLGVEFILVALVQLWPTMPTWVAIGFFVVGAVLLAIWPLSLMRQRGLIDISNMLPRNRRSPLSIEFDPRDARYVSDDSGYYGRSFENRSIKVAVRNNSNQPVNDFQVYIDEIQNSDGTPIKYHSELRYDRNILPLWCGEQVIVSVALLDRLDDQGKIRISSGEYEKRRYMLKISARMDDYEPEKKTFELYVNTDGLLQMREVNGSR